ncbi:ATP-dependent nuclease [Henriciella marina]|uniref:AAA family ATPase n=1 Tax=Henriciella marina TaxID=453851 RepID=A0ABT4LWQ4_9PROT|nr:AAA family ATPase [Henriciella marina]MCZ4298810.1 AAA family ATPase [Henriciella marina]
MTISRVIIENYRCLRKTDLQFSDGLNILIGDNETGKSSVLEAINLCLTGQIRRRDASYELHPYLFNKQAIDDYVAALRKGLKPAPPKILIEIYFNDSPDLAEAKGTNNSLNLDCPGLKISIGLDEEHFSEEYAAYIEHKDRVSTIPVEYFKIDWFNFAHDPVSTRSKPLRPALIDPSSLTNAYAANRYVLDLARDFLNRKQKADLALSFRHLREVFQEDDSVRSINDQLLEHKGEISDRSLSVALDLSAKTSWERNVTPHLDDIPLGLVGKGEQTAIKIKLALAANDACDLLLIEEPETHQSHGNLCRLIEYISDRSNHKQLILTTHSSFVLNKLGIDAAIMFNGRTGLRLNNLSESTRDYFMKLPGHDTLRMVLAKKSILVEGPSDELIVQKAYRQSHGKSALADGVEIISVRSLAFKRFLEIAAKLQLAVSVVTDNDGNVEALKNKYSEYNGNPTIRICFSENEKLRTLEPQLVDINDIEIFNAALKRNFENKQQILKYLISNKADAALALFETEQALTLPTYIADAVQ